MTKNVKNATRLYLEQVNEENKQLKKDMQIMSDELTYFKEYCADLEDEVNRKERMIRGLKINNSSLTLERNQPLSEIQDLKQTHKYLTSEDAGRKFAEELLGKPMTPEEVAIDAAENGYKPYVGDDF